MQEKQEWERVKILKDYKRISSCFHGNQWSCGRKSTDEKHSYISREEKHFPCEYT